MQKISLVYFRYSLLASLVCDFFSLAFFHHCQRHIMCGAYDSQNYIRDSGL